MQVASFTGFLRTILIIMLVWYGVKILMRFFAPYVVRYMSKKMQERFSGQFQQEQEAKNRPKEGETIIDKIPERRQTSDKKVGEYVDYEEID
ncbi:uncharacterized protein DUF4834 [Gelidibacter sediminis]|uniref:Uncharacterized protein DUF4834 n=1 Tax=Gelidibacter sediminis TaxID=1608710 RepID=A0A4V3F8D5_9FLAO|nr:DUF4834 family protein [Gelidibacter sediminis]TDU39946.1 uncharacterized protein DUF4834 [Gelidibacter sediminis]